MADEDPVSADPGTNDSGEGVLVPDVVEPERRPSVDREGDGRGLVDLRGPFGGADRAFDVLTDVDGSLVVRLMGELDVSTVPELEVAVDQLLSGMGGRLVVDARDLEFADSSVIALWIRWANRGPVEIRNAPPMLRARIFKMGLADRFTLTP